MKAEGKKRKMEKELEDKLVKDFPILYRDSNASMQETCMCWGFPSRGWYNLIYDLSKTLETIAEKQPSPPEQNIIQKKLYPYVESFSDLLREKKYRFWHKKPVAKTRLQKIKIWFTDHKYSKYVPAWYWLKIYGYFMPPEDNRLKATQVKEKFGSLRFYTNLSSPEIDKAIRNAEALSCVTCEECGQSGCMRSDGWIVTMCDQCYKKYQEKRNEI
jgi:hypothetical protein